MKGLRWQGHTPSQPELETFTVKITDAGNETFGASKDRAHDDLVLAVRLALWAAENMPSETADLP